MTDALTAALNAGVSLDAIEKMTTVNGFSLDEIARAAESIAARNASQHDAIGADDVRECLDTDDRKTDKDGFPEVRCTASNFLEIMRRDPYFAGLKFNVLRELPELHTSAKKRLWTDADDAAARIYIEQNYGISSAQKFDDAVKTLIQERGYDPIVDELSALEWDGTHRVERCLIDLLGAADDRYSRECSRLLFAGGVHRAFEPGCRFDCVIVLSGAQGCGKSTFVQWLSLKQELYSSAKTFTGQAGVEAISGKWIVEIEELLATLANSGSGSRREELCKAFLSTASDFYRKSYDRRPGDYPRHCIFVGTTNKEQFLTDKTGNRRWFPVRVHGDARTLYDNEADTKSYIRQCWAEMVHAYQNGDALARPVPSADALDAIRTNREAATEDDYRVGLIGKFLDDHPEKDAVCLRELWESALHPDETRLPEMRRGDSNDLAEILIHNFGWSRGDAQYFGKLGRQKAFVRPRSEPELPL